MQQVTQICIICQILNHSLKVQKNKNMSFRHASDESGPLASLDDIDGATRDNPLTGNPDCPKRKETQIH